MNSVWFVLAALLLADACPSGYFPPEPVVPHPVAMGSGIYLDRVLFDAPRMRAIVNAGAADRLAWTREEFHWDLLEPEPGVWDARVLARYDQAVAALAVANIHILGLLAYSNPWSSGEQSPATEAQRGEYAQRDCEYYVEE